MDSVDILNSPQLYTIPWDYVTLEPGDCLFLPARYMHQVKGIYTDLIHSKTFTILAVMQKKVSKFKKMSLGKWTANQSPLQLEIILMLSLNIGSILHPLDLCNIPDLSIGSV